MGRGVIGGIMLAGVVSACAVVDPVEALAIARRNGSASDVVVVTGSTFIVAELREWWLVAA